MENSNTNPVQEKVKITDINPSELFISNNKLKILKSLFLNYDNINNATKDMNDNDKKDYEKLYKNNILLLCGKPGNGKSTIIKYICNKYKKIPYFLALSTLDASNYISFTNDFINCVHNAEKEKHVLVIKGIELVFNENNTNNDLLNNIKRANILDVIITYLKCYQGIVFIVINNKNILDLPNIVVKNVNYVIETIEDALIFNKIIEKYNKCYFPNNILTSEQITKLTRFEPNLRAVKNVFTMARKINSDDLFNTLSVLFTTLFNAKLK